LDRERLPVGVCWLEPVGLDLRLEIAPDLGGDVREYYTHDTQLSMSLAFSKSTRNLGKGKSGKRQKAKGNSKSQGSSLAGFDVPFALCHSPFAKLLR
jgi:hypothetical protein